MMVLRDYQRAAVESVRECEGNPLIVLPTGSGKSLVAAAICAERVARGERVLVLTHRKELIEQDARALSSYAPHVKQSIYSASVGQKDTGGEVVFAQVQSLWKRPEVIGELVGTVLIDEAHLIPRSDDTMYGAVLSAYSHCQCIGLTATPYRLDSGRLDQGPGALFDRVAIQVTARSLVDEGYLSPLVGLGALEQADLTGVKVRQGDYVKGELEDLLTDEKRIAGACADIAKHLKERKAALVYCVTVAHAEEVARRLEGHDIPCTAVHGQLGKDERSGRVSGLRDGKLKALVNCEVLTTGVDLPIVDTLALLRPTLSKGLHVQILGRGMRLAEGKAGCLVLDYVGNCRRHGDLDGIGMTEMRDLGQEAAEEAAERERARRELTHGTRADADPFCGSNRYDVQVLGVKYFAMTAKARTGLTNLVVEYTTSAGKIRQWVCVEYTGGARWHAERWFAKRGQSAPRTAHGAVVLAKHLAWPDSLTLERGGKYPRIVMEHFA
jgi:DNA repair protein RadD